MTLLNHKSVRKIGSAALRIYANHMISFTAGAVAGGIYVALALVAANSFVVLQ